MSRKRRHIRARHDEWIVVHRDPPSSDNPFGCLIAIIIIACLLNSC